MYRMFFVSSSTLGPHGRFHIVDIVNIYENKQWFRCLFDRLVSFSFSISSLAGPLNPKEVVFLVLLESLPALPHSGRAG